MKISFRYIVLSCFLLVFASCSEFSRLTKSDDYNYVYERALDFYEAHNNEKARVLFERVEPYYQGTLKEDTIMFYKAMSSFRQQDYITSNSEFNLFRRSHGRSVFLEESEYLIAMGYYFQSPKPERDQVPTQMALLSFNEYLVRYPNSVKREMVLDYIDELQKKLYDKALLNSKVYCKTGYYKSAIHALKLSLSEYPETIHREETLYLITKASYLYAENSLEELQRSRYLDMLDSYYNLISEYPDSDYLEEVTDMYEKAQRELARYNPQEETETAEDPENLTEKTISYEDGSKKERRSE